MDIHFLVALVYENIPEMGCVNLEKLHIYYLDSSLHFFEIAKENTLAFSKKFAEDVKNFDFEKFTEDTIDWLKDTYEKFKNFDEIAENWWNTKAGQAEIYYEEWKEYYEEQKDLYETYVEYRKAIISEEYDFHCFNVYCSKKWCNLDWLQEIMEYRCHIILYQGPLGDLWEAAVAHDHVELQELFKSIKVLNCFYQLVSLDYYGYWLTYDNQYILKNWNYELLRIHYPSTYFTYCFDMLRYTDYRADPKRSFWMVFFKIFSALWFVYDKKAEAKYRSREDNMLLAELDNKKNWIWLWSVNILGAIWSWASIWCASNNYKPDNFRYVYNKWMHRRKLELDELWWQGDLSEWRDIEFQRAHMSWWTYMFDWRMPMFKQVLGIYEPPTLTEEELYQLDYERRLEENTLMIFKFLCEFALPSVCLFIMVNLILIRVYSRIIVFLALKIFKIKIGTKKMNEYAARQIAKGAQTEKIMAKLESDAVWEKESFQGLINSEIGKDKRKKIIK